MAVTTTTKTTGKKTKTPTNGAVNAVLREIGQAATKLAPEAEPPAHPAITPAERECLGGTRTSVFREGARPTVGALIDACFEAPEESLDAPLPTKALRCLLDELDVLRDAVVGSDGHCDHDQLARIISQMQTRARVAILLDERMRHLTPENLES